MDNRTRRRIFVKAVLVRYIPYRLRSLSKKRLLKLVRQQRFLLSLPRGFHNDGRARRDDKAEDGEVYSEQTREFWRKVQVQIEE
jgi:hypothetical protein